MRLPRGGGATGSLGAPETPSWPGVPSQPCTCVLTLQVLFRAKDLDPEPRSHVVRGNHTQSALLAGLRKFVLYELQVLAFTRIGNGVPSSPLILERTKDDGTIAGCSHSPNSVDDGHSQLNFQTLPPFIFLAFFSVEKNKTELFFSHHLYGQFQTGVNFYNLIMKLCGFES